MKVSEVSETQADNLVHMLDAYAEKGGHHLLHSARLKS